MELYDWYLKTIGETETHWHKRQVSIAFMYLCIYGKRNNEKLTANNVFYNIYTFPKILFQSTNKYYNKKRGKSEEASKYSNVSKFCINVLQLERKYI